MGIIITQRLFGREVPANGHYCGTGEPTYPNYYVDLREATVMQIDTGYVMLGGYLPNKNPNGGANLILNAGDKLALTGYLDVKTRLPELKLATTNDYSIGESYVSATILPQKSMLVQFSNKVEKI
jgi:hypothetical protein